MKKITVLLFLIPPLLFPPASTAQSPPNILSQLDRELHILSEKVQPAVVQILVSSYAAQPGSDPTLPVKQHSSGSGVILDSDGYIVTNAHVVNGARRVQVVLRRSRKERTQQQSILKTEGQVIGAQVLKMDRETDLAVLKIARKNLPTLSLGDSDALTQGQLVFAFGSPLGLENSVTMGVVSAVARQLRPEDLMIYIQTDAPINPGNSGGPLTNIHGEVVGINTLIFSQSGGSEGIGFAAPSNIVKNIFQQIRDTGRVRRGHIGASAQTLTPTLRAGLGLTSQGGIILSDVFPEGPADRAGLQIGDIVLSLNGKPMENGRQFHINLYGPVLKQGVALEILRNGTTRVVQVPVEERPDDPDRFASLVHPEHNQVPRLGILGVTLDAKTASLFARLRQSTGVIVAALHPNALGWQSGFLPGDIIHAVNTTPVHGLEGLKDLLAPLQSYDPVVVQIERQAKLMYLSFEME
ncbi:MAG: trypsin-like peptidase domain-containing protein [bacterium]|nr:trypsin-like peptidase domain-containing protein [bacterium]